MREHHVLQQQHNFPGYAHVLRRFLNPRHAAHQMPNQQPVRGIIAHAARFVADHFRRLAQVVQDNARVEQLRVQERVRRHDVPRQIQHTRRVVEQTGAFRVVQPLRRREPFQLVARQPKHLAHDFLQSIGLEGINRVLDVLAHHFRLFGRTRDQLRHVHLVLRQGGAHPLNAELLAAVVLLHQPLHFDDRALLGHVHQLIPVPVFAVDVARFIREGEVEVRAALLIRPRIRRANEQKPDEAGVGFQLIDCHG